MNSQKLVLAFDTANESIAIGVGALDAAARRIVPLVSRQVAAHRASNTKLLPEIESVFATAGLDKHQIACVCVGRGPGSFTGVRIAMATAKGVASALGVALVGVNSLDAVAATAALAGTRGRLLVVADAMRKEVYPAYYTISQVTSTPNNQGAERPVGSVGVNSRLSAVPEAKRSGAAENEAGIRDAEGVTGGADAPHVPKWARGISGVDADAAVAACAHWAQVQIARETPTRVVKAAQFAQELAAQPDSLQITGDALAKYADSLCPLATALPNNLWVASGAGLLKAAEIAWQQAEFDITDAVNFAPGKLLPVYTRLSDAEETERARLAAAAQAAPADGWRAATPQTARNTMHATSHVGEMKGAAAPGQLVFRPLDAAGAAQVAALETACMGTDAWNAALVADELTHANRVWWQAVDAQGKTQGYAGGLVIDGDVQILKVAVAPAARRQGAGAELMRRVIEDARNLGTQTASLEVRAANAGAIAFYERLGFEHVGVRPRYYSDGEDACIMNAQIDKLQFLNQSAHGKNAQGAECPEGPVGSVGVNSRLSAVPEAKRSGAAENKAGIRDAEGVTGGSDGASDSYAPNGRSASFGTFGTAKAPAEVGGMSLKNQAATSTNAAHPLILAIETSCDETAAAVINGQGQLQSDVIASQVDFHARFGGVVPEIASRKHTEAICGVCDVALETAGVNYQALDAVAVTYAPGLVGALVVGVAFAKGVAWAAGVPLIGVNHLEGHLYANKLAQLDGQKQFEPPAVVSLVSGGNTMLVHMKAWGQYEVLGSTIDDAVGEAFDKVAKALGLPYPGGPHISRLAAEGNPRAIEFPRAMMHSGDLRFSLSGLKTAVTSYINAQRAAGEPLNLPDICASFQAAVVDVQVKKASMALDQTHAPTFCLGGGVAANPALRAAYEKMCAARHVTLVMPPLNSCGDNAGMIALVALDRYCAQKFMGLDADAQAHSDISQPY